MHSVMIAVAQKADRPRSEDRAAPATHEPGDGVEDPVALRLRLSVLASFSRREQEAGGRTAEQSVGSRGSVEPGLFGPSPRSGSDRVRCLSQCG